MERAFITQYSDLIGLNITCCCLLVKVILKGSTEISELCWTCECLGKEYRLMVLGCSVLGKHVWLRGRHREQWETAGEKLHTLCWVVHVARMGEKINTHRNLVHGTEGKRQLRRLRCRRYAINWMDVKKVRREDVEWNSVAQVRESSVLLWPR